MVKLGLMAAAIQALAVFLSLTMVVEVIALCYNLFFSVTAHVAPLSYLLVAKWTGIAGLVYFVIISLVVTVFAKMINTQLSSLNRRF